MTSSLVGSEMCIRDRRNLAASGALDAPLAKVRGAGIGKWMERNPLPPPCLLYTSDAADDM
eukprot:7054508-Prorocentrum_lima.AAC.1